MNNRLTETIKECGNMIKDDILNEVRDRVGLIKPFLITPNPFLWAKCDGSLLDIYDAKYATLYKVIGKYYNQFLSTPILENQFALPLIGEDLGQIMVDNTGVNDKVRGVNTNAKWFIPKNILNDFNLTDQKQMVKNGLYDDNTDNVEQNEEGDSRPFTLSGSDVFVVQDYKDFNIVSKSEDNKLRTGDGVKFKGIFGIFYIRYRNYEDLTQEEKYQFEQLKG